MSPVHGLKPSRLVEAEMVTSNPNARADLIPVGRFGAVEETADVAVMLAPPRVGDASCTRWLGFR